MNEHDLYAKRVSDRFHAQKPVTEALQSIRIKECW